MLRQSDWPKSFGRYRPIAILGEGGQGRVYLTLMQGPAGFSKLMVVKTLRRELLDDNEALSRFLQEARVAARLNHPNIVLTHEVVAVDGNYLIAMEYLEGQSLATLLKRTRELDRVLPLSLHVSILRDLLVGLHYAHELTDYDGKSLQVVHRDVSPQNAFVTYEGQTKLLDFGVAKVVGASVATQGRSLRGKFAYMAPEQAMGKEVDRRADVFSAGVMLWEAIAGRRINRGYNEAETLARRLTGGEPKIRDVVQDVPLELAGVCDKATAVDRGDRYASAEEFRNALDHWLEGQTGRSVSEEIGNLVADLFAAERSDLRSRIEQQVRVAEDTSQRDLPLPNFGGSSPESSPFASGPSASAPEAATVAASVAALRRQARPRRMAAGGVAVLIAGVTAAVVHAIEARQTSDAPAAAVPAASIKAVPDVSATARIRVSITVSPPDADLFLDDAGVSTPLNVEALRDGRLHRVRASAPGYLTERRTVPFDKDVKLELSLKHKPAPTRKPRHGTRSHASSPSGSAKPPAKPSASIGIDETNPYGP